MCSTVFFVVGVAVVVCYTLCIYAVPSLALLGVPDLHETTVNVFRIAPSVHPRWVFHVPYEPKGGPVPIADVVDLVAVKVAHWLHSTKDDVTNHQ